MCSCAKSARAKACEGARYEDVYARKENGSQGDAGEAQRFLPNRYLASPPPHAHYFPYVVYSLSV